MRFTCDGSPSTFKLFDDKGREIVDAPIHSLEISVTPWESRAVINVDYPSFDLEIATNNVTLQRTCKLKYAAESGQ